MKRKILSLLLSIFVVCECGGGVYRALAKSFTFTDLSEYGISTMRVHRTTSVVCDGMISSDEYGSGTSFRDGGGLYLLTNESYSENNRISPSALQESYVSVCGEYVYFAFRLCLEGASLVPVTNEMGSCYRISVSLGLSLGEHPVFCGSRLTNTYYFSSEDFSCVGFYGDRIARSTEEKAVSSKPLSSLIQAYRDNGVVTSDGVKWNAEHYCKNASFSIREKGGASTVVAEVKIPLEDVLLSVHPTRRDTIRSVLKDKNQTLCGSFSSRVVLKANSCLVTGLPSSVSLSGESLTEWMKQNFETAPSGLYIPKIIPVPLYWCGQPSSNKAEVSVLAKDPNTSSDENVPDSDVSVGKENSTQTGSAINPEVPTTSSVRETVPENDESVFESLPDADALLPEDTQIVYDTKTSSTTKEKENDNSLASNILSTVTGALIFASVLILCIYFRDSGKQEDAKEQKGKKDKKRKEKSSGQKK